MRLGWLADVVVLCAVLLHLVLAPYCKVEESFNLHAVFDWLYADTGGVLDVVRQDAAKFAGWDHRSFPGVVPRTFLGAGGVALLARPLLAALPAGAPTRLGAQLVARAVLGLGSVLGIRQLRLAAEDTLGAHVAGWFTALLAAQFHVPFYASRPLPNTFALGLCSSACADWLRGGRAARVIGLLAVAGLVFRCDVALLALPVGAHLLLSRQVTLVRAVALAVAFAALAIGTTVLLDSPLWGRTLWPEGEVLRFNTVENRSGEYGVSPAHWYWTSALPRALLGSLPLAPLGALLERRVRPQLLAALAYVAAYSALPHKELRFLFPVLPLFTLCAACGAARLATNARKPGPARKLGGLVAVGAVVGSVAATCVLAGAARLNYPGGAALQLLHETYAGAPPPAGGFNVHVGVWPAMTGVSRFGEVVPTTPGAPAWRYSKEEGVAPAQLAARGFTHALSGDADVPGFRLVRTVDGYAGLSLGRRFPFLSFRTAPQVYVHERAPR